MIALRTRHRLRIKQPSGEVRTFGPGDQFTARSVDGLLGLLETGKIMPAGPCPICRAFDYWLSIHGVLVCNQCHPAMAAAVKVRTIQKNNNQRETRRGER
jgi:hypothetical protein